MPINTLFFWTRVAPVLCAASLGIGQILFKLVARAAARGPIQESPRALLILGASLLLYGVTTLVWIATLRYLPLSKAYPIMALAYVFVPIAAFFFLGEQVSLVYWGGVFLVVAGIILIGQSQVVTS